MTPFRAWRRALVLSIGLGVAPLSRSLWSCDLCSTLAQEDHQTMVEVFLSIPWHGDTPSRKQRLLGTHRLLCEASLLFLSRCTGPCTSLCYELSLQVRFSVWRANLRSATPSTTKMVAAHYIQILSPYSFFNKWCPVFFFSFLPFRECIPCIFLVILAFRGGLWECRCTYAMCTSILSGDVPLGNQRRGQVLENGSWQRLTAQEDLV